MQTFKKTILTTSIILSLTGFMITGCGQANKSASYESSQPAEESSYIKENFSAKMSADPSADALSEADSDNDNGNDNSAEQPAIAEEQTATHELQSGVVNQQLADKKLLISANAEFKVKDVVASVNHIEELTQQAKGYIASSRIANNEYGTTKVVQGDKVLQIHRYVRYSEMTVRIPKDNIGQFLKSLQKEIQFLQHSEFTTEDVTLDIEHQQLQAQLSGEQASELEKQRLKAKKADDQNSNVDTINSTYNAKRQQALADIERKRIEDRLKYSTIQLSFSQPEALYQSTYDNIEQIIASHEPSLSEQIQERLLDGWQIFKQVILGFVQLWWLWLMILFSVPLLRLIIRFWGWSASNLAVKKTSKKPKQANQPKQSNKNINDKMDGEC